MGAFPDYLKTEFVFSLDGEVKQRGLGSDMMFSVDRALPLLRESFPVVPGDVVFTGTPKGVGPLRPGQRGTLTWGNKLSYEVLFTD